MSTDLIQRLESVTSRLEALANNMHTNTASTTQSNGIHSSSNGIASSASSNSKVLAYEIFHSEYVLPFIHSASAIKGLESISKYADIAYSKQKDVIEATGVCKKPSDQELLSYVNPIVQVIESSTKNVDRKSPLFNHQQSWAEAVASFQWLMTTTPKQAITDALEATDFYLVKILTQAKNSNDTVSADYAKQLKSLLSALSTFAVENYRAGLEWNPKGISITQFQSVSSSSSNNTSSSSKVTPPPAPAPQSAPSAPSYVPPPSTSTAAPVTSSVGMGAVFGELTGTGGTFKLNKVTDDMKAKNRKNEPKLESKSIPSTTATSKPSTSSSKPTAALVKPSSTNLVKGTWFVENYSNTNETITIPNVQLKENVFISNCNNINISIPDKTKSITVNSSKRVTISFKSVVSIFEIVNSQNIKIECLDTVPSIQIDKSSGIQMYLSRAGVAVIPNIITSNVSEINLVVPGVTDDDDPVELPLPEQYISKYDIENKKVITEAVSHSSSG